MKEDYKKRIIVQPFYTMIVSILPSLFFITMFIICTIYWIENLHFSEWIVPDIVILCFAVLSTLYSFYYIQFASLNDNGITIRNIFGKIAFIAWDNIIEFSNNNLITHDSRAVICFDWIVIKTDKEQIAKRGGVNKKNKGPWQIIASEKNIAIIKKFATKYAKNAKIEI